MERETRRIEGPQAERDLKNLKKPMLFQCAQCKQILGNSTQLQEWKRIKDNSFLLFKTLERKAIRLSEALSEEERGCFAYCSYRSIICNNCNSKIGMLFVSTTSANHKFVDVYTLIEQSVVRYDLGDTIEVDQSLSYGNEKENAGLNKQTFLTVPDAWTPSTAGRYKEEGKAANTPKIEKEEYQALFANF